MSVMTTIFTKNEEVQFSVRNNKLIDRINRLKAVYEHIEKEYGTENICLNKLWDDKTFTYLLPLPYKFSFANIQKIGLGKTYKNIYGDRKITGTKILADNAGIRLLKYYNIGTFEERYKDVELTAFGHTVKLEPSEKTSPLTYLGESGAVVNCYRQVPLFLFQKEETVDIATDFGTVTTTVTYVRLNPDFLQIANYMMGKCKDYLANWEKYKAISLIKQTFNYCKMHDIKFEEAFEEFLTDFWDGEQS